MLTNVLNTALYQHLSFDFMRDIAPVAPVANAPYVILVTNSLPAKTVPEFIAYAKANPGKINMASGGIGTSSHIFGVLFMTMAGIDMVHVPYRTNYMSDLIGGQVQAVINPIPQSMEFVKCGKVRALAVTTKTRLDALPDLPTAAEFVPGYEALGWYGIGAPKRDARRHRPQTQRRAQCGARRTRGQGAARRFGRRADADGAASNSHNSSPTKTRNGAR